MEHTHTFQQLLGKLEQEEFFNNFWGKRPLHIAAGARNSYLPFTDAELNYFLSNSRLHYPYVKLFSKGKAVSFETFKNPNLGVNTSVVDMLKVFSLLHHGHTLAINSLDRMAPQLIDFCQNLSMELKTKIWANAYLTPADQQGLSKHSDAHDVFVLQVAGHKCWTINLNREEVKNIELCKGDLLYLPKGTPHQAKTENGPSIHITFGANFKTHADLFKEVCEKAFESVAFEKRLSLFDKSLSSKEIQAFIDSANELLTEQAINDSYDNILNKGTDESIKTNYLDEWYKIENLKPETILRKPEKNAIQLFNEGKFLELRFNGKSLIFPAFLKDFFEEVMRQEKFSVETLKTSLSESERLKIIKKLLSEGFLCLYN